MRRRISALLSILGFLALGPLSDAAWAQAPAPRPRAPSNAEAPAARGEAATEQQRPREALLPDEKTTHHTITVDGKQLAYTARAGALTLINDSGERRAEIFYVAYVLDDTHERRPITFAFNGGPGAASAYLHLGAIGPRIVDLGDGRSPPGGKTPKIVDNPDTWLPFTDLVFIDPVGTGYSHALRDVKDVPKEFWGVNQDLDSLSQTIRLALTKLDRSGSPVYLAGESYGGFRAARLLGRLPTGQGIAIDGVMLVSPALEFSLRGNDELDPLPWALRLPSYAAVNLEAQGKLTPEALVDAERFALGDYVAHLIRPDSTRDADIYSRVEALIGLPADFVARWHGRIPSGVFVKEIGRAHGRLASQYDASVLGDDAYPASPTARGGDPVFDGIIAPLTTAFVDYVRGELQYRTDSRYRLLNGEIARRWDWGRSGPSSSLGTSGELREALALNHHLRVVIAHGMTDLVTPYMASRYLIDHLPEALAKDRVTLRLHPGGHMMYLRPESRAGLRDDARGLYSD